MAPALSGLSARAEEFGDDVPLQEAAPYRVVAAGDRPTPRQRRCEGNMGEWVGGGWRSDKRWVRVGGDSLLIRVLIFFLEPRAKPPPPQNLKPLNLIFPDLNQIGSVKK